ncbi:hypothetical protein FACS1894137_16010 [Spirochaetia bacterium]|nr:hypothetical protein FACS1894137_16010 [Spirochaetia bacterium]
MPDKRNSALKYTRIPNEEIYPIIKRCYDRFKIFLAKKGFPDNIEFNMSVFDIVDIINRVDKRRAYYYCFHEEMEIDECKVAALYAYWVLKLKPFTITDKRYFNKPSGCNINEAFAIILIYASLVLMKRIVKAPEMKKSYYNLLEYSFRYRNFSIDSFIVLVESITTETWKRNYPDLGHQTLIK